MGKRTPRTRDTNTIHQVTQQKQYVKTHKTYNKSKSLFWASLQFLLSGWLPAAYSAGNSVLINIWPVIVEVKRLSLVSSWSVTSGRVFGSPTVQEKKNLSFRRHDFIMHFVIQTQHVSAIS